MDKIKRLHFLKDYVNSILEDNTPTWKEIGDKYGLHPDKIRKYWRQLKDNYANKGLWFRDELIEDEWIEKVNASILVKNREHLDLDDSEHYSEAKDYVYDQNKTRFLISYCQNATPVHKNLLRNMEIFASTIDANIHIIAGTYRNPTSIWSEKDQSDQWWSKEVLPYLDANRHDIHDKLTIMSDVRIQPTAVNPLSGLHGMGKEKSAIFGHPKVHLETLAALEGYNKKHILTTGAVSIKNYTDSKAGSKAEFYHMYGFVIVELDGNKVHIRQITADDNGNFYTLNYKVKNGEVSIINTVPAIVMGDIHVAELNKEFDEYREKTFFKKIRPENIVMHDVYDGKSISHWTEKDPFKQFKNVKEGHHLIKPEINECLDYIESKLKYNPIIVRSNHDDFLDRFLVRADWKKNIVNAQEYLKYASLLLGDNAPQGIIPYEINRRFGDLVKTLGRDDSFRMINVEMGQHGDIGRNGSKGSLNQFRMLNVKMIIGHSHTPGRKDNVIQVGTSSHLRVGFNIGPSSWCHADAILHFNGKTELIIYDDHDYSFTTLF